MTSSTVIYIPGFGRSGSTLLERVLGSAEPIRATGELASIPEVMERSDFLCSCGEPVRSCDLWGAVLDGTGITERDPDELKEIQRRMESFFGCWRHLPGFAKDAKKAYADYCSPLFRTLGNTKGGAIFIIDSSKTARKCFFRPMALSGTGELQVKVIHLVRDGRGCIWSYLKGSNRKMELGEFRKISLAGIRAVTSWVIANLGAHLFQVTHDKGDYFRVRYEDFIDDPSEILKSLEGFLGIDLGKQSVLVSEGREIPRGHQVAGNRMRLSRLTELRKDVEWHSKLPNRYRALFALFAWPLALAYSYPLLAPGKRGGRVRKAAG